MTELYTFLTGPLTWLAFGVLVFGAIYRLTYMWALAKKKDGSSIYYMDSKFGLRSIFRWLTPFATLGWRENSSVTGVTFIFHLCLLAVPIFLGAHEAMWQTAFGISFWTIPNQIADYLTLVVIAGGIFFAVRRLTNPTVKFVSTWKDWGTLIMVVAPFVTGFLAYHQFFNYNVMIVLHVISGLIWIAMIPFARLSHVLFFWFSRIYIGSEFGKVRHARDW